MYKDKLHIILCKPTFSALFIRQKVSSFSFHVYQYLTFIIINSIQGQKYFNKDKIILHWYELYQNLSCSWS